MTETQRKIKEYQAMLPGLKERVMAVAMLMVVSLTMVVSASFAWYTLSRAPEVSMMSTTVAGNGNLEIALVGLYDEDGNVLEPNVSAVGDSSATEGQTLVGANITWGNLVNLSDSSYGLNQISLRPSLLSGYNLTRTPLYGATYSSDGRVQDISQTYEYASWTQAEDGTWYFAAGDKSSYGVRAIASVTYKNITGNAAVTTMWTRINNAYANAVSEYMGIIGGTTMVADGISCMDALSTLMEIYVQDKADTMLGNGSSADYSGVVTYTYRLIGEFYDVIEAEGEALLYMANLQAYLSNNDNGTETFKTIDELVGYSDQQLWNNYGVKLTSLATYRTSRSNILKSMAGLEDLAIACDPDTVANPEPVKWSQIGTSVQYLVNIGTTTIEDMEIGTLSRDDLSGLLGILMYNSQSNMSDVIIYDGALADTEQRLGAFLDDNDIWVSVFLNARVSVISVNRDVYAYVKTDASDDEVPYTSNQDRTYTSGLENTGTGGDAVAKDTYGMAIDLWTRTNAEDAILILEGTVEYTPRTVTCTDKYGNTADVYTMSFEGALTDVYMLEETDTEGNSVTNVYNATSHTLLGTKTELEEGGYSITDVPNTEDVVTGFHGENRIWEDWENMMEAGLISEDSTTQGAGSCYVFYADPSDQTRILELLDAFTIAFLKQDGAHIATARLDTANAYAINGKVTVPLKLTSGASYTDEEGISRLGITEMQSNEATWITAVIYLDGMQLTNEQVLAAGEIEGRLNLQFATSVSLDAAENADLQAKYRTITASASSGEQDSSAANDPITYEYDGKAKAVTVTLDVSGDQPINVSGFFIRYISATQGSRTDEQTFTSNGDGTWTATFDLTKPGVYTFGSVIADGVEYILDDTPAVEISGLGIDSVRCELSSGIVMTADSYLDVGVHADINATEELMPDQVRALFRSSTGQEFTALMSYNGEEWYGTAKITSSGTFTLQYLVVDGEFTELTESQKTTLIVYLGLYARVWCNGIEVTSDKTPVESTSFEFKEAVTADMQIKILDDTGNEIMAQENVWLYYHNSGSALDQDGMSGQMYWNADTGYYEGSMQMQSAGIYTFDRVAVTNDSSDGSATSNIRRSTNAPVFTALPPDPPAYDSHSTVAYQFVPNSGQTATMTVNLYYADAATIWAVIEDSHGNEYVMPSVGREKLDENYYAFTFNVPTNATGTYNGKQDGEWTLTALCMQNVYVDGTMYSVTYDDSGKVVDPIISGENKNCHIIDAFTRVVNKKEVTDVIKTYVVQTVNVAAVMGDDEKYTGAVFGKDGSGTTTGAFMASYDVSGVTFTITDWSGKEIQGIGNVALTIDYGDNSSTYGGYTGAVFSDDMPWSLSYSGGVYTAAKQTFQFAGSYSTELSFSVGTISYSVSGPAYQVWSLTPTVTITAINPAAGSHAADNTKEQSITDTSSGGCNPTYTTHSAHGTATSSLSADGLTAVVYFQCFHASAGDYHYYYNTDNGQTGVPQVTITLSGITNFQSARVEFSDSSRIYSQMTYTGSGLAANGTWETTGGGAAFTWTSGNTSATRYIGYSWNQKSRLGDDANAAGQKIAAGTITANKLIVVYNGVEYEFTIPTITINNPY